MDTARVIEVVETELTRRSDGDRTPIRVVRQYWSRDGKLLAENDPRDDYEHAIHLLTNFLFEYYPGEINPEDLPNPLITVGVAMRYLKAGRTSARNGEPNVAE